MADLSPASVAKRLARLRELWQPLDAAEARLALSPPTGDEPFEVGVGRRLAELRALCELAEHLHRRVTGGG